jgi:predicted DNA-binding transcriptional regulator AlpA
MDDMMDRQTRVANHVNEFCREHGISRGHFYNLLKRGEGPKIMRVGRRTLVSAEAAAEWRRRMEVAAEGQRHPAQQVEAADVA